MEVFRLMEGDGVDPSGTAYGLAVTACARLCTSRNGGQRAGSMKGGQRAGDESDGGPALGEALALLGEAHELRDELLPPVDRRAYVAVLQAHCRGGEPTGAAQVLKLMDQVGLADEASYELAIACAAQARR